MYILFGTKTNGKIVDYYLRYTRGTRTPSGPYESPIVEFQTDKFIIKFMGEENVDFKIGDNVDVLYLSWNPSKAKIYSFLNLFTRPGIELFSCLFIWWAFISSYKRIFDKPKFKQIIKNIKPIKINFKKPIDRNKLIKIDSHSNKDTKISSDSIVAFIVSIIAFIGIPVFIIMSFTRVYLENKISLSVYIIILIAIGLIILYIIRSLRKNNVP